MRAWWKRIRCGHGGLKYWFTYYGDQRLYLSDTQGPHLHRCERCGYTLYLYQKLIPAGDGAPRHIDPALLCGVEQGFDEPW